MATSVNGASPDVTSSSHCVATEVPTKQTESNSIGGHHIAVFLGSCFLKESGSRREEWFYVHSMRVRLEHGLLGVGLGRSRNGGVESPLDKSFASLLDFIPIFVGLRRIAVSKSLVADRDAKLQKSERCAVESHIRESLGSWSVEISDALGGAGKARAVSVGHRPLHAHLVEEMSAAEEVPSQQDANGDEECTPCIGRSPDRVSVYSNSSYEDDGERDLEPPTSDGVAYSVPLLNGKSLSKDEEKGSNGAGSDQPACVATTVSTAEEAVVLLDSQTLQNGAGQVANNSESITRDLVSAVSLCVDESSLYHEVSAALFAAMDTGSAAGSRSVSPPAPPCNVAALASDSDVEYYQMLVLENACNGFGLPCVLDLKMGSRQYGLNTPADKKQRKIERTNTTTIGKYGIRLSGLQYFNTRDACESSAQSKPECVRMSKHACGRLNMAELSRVFLDFLNDDEALRCVFVEKCEKLREAFQTQTELRFFTSSLLFVYDAEKPASSARIVMIDFAYTYQMSELIRTKDPESSQEKDFGYIQALDSLLAVLNKELKVTEDGQGEK